MGKPFRGDVREHLESKWLNAIDLKGKEPKVTIGEVTMETVQKRDSDENVDKLCVWFKGKDKGWLLGKQASESIAAILGFDSSKWIGGEIRLCTITTGLGPGIRARKV